MADVTRFDDLWLKGVLDDDLYIQTGAGTVDAP